MKRLTGTVALAIALVTVAGSAMAAKEKSALKVTVDPAFFDKTITKIGLMKLVYPITNDAMMEEILPDLVNGTLQDQGEFTILYPDDIRVAAERGGYKEAFETLVRVWRTRGEIDAQSLAKVNQAVGLDAIVCVELTHWEQKKLDITEEGYSTTTVGLRCRMWNVADQALHWEASLVKVANSPPYTPSGSTADRVPESPRYEEVAEAVVQEVIGSYPKPEDKERIEKEAKKKKKKEGGR